MGSIRFAPNCGCCSGYPPTTCEDQVAAKWRSVETISDPPTFSRKWIVFKAYFQLRKKSNGAVGCGSGYVNGGDPYEVLLIWDSESAGTGYDGCDEVTFVRVRSTSPNLEVEAVFDAIPKASWPFGSPGTGPGPDCSPIMDDVDPECTFQYAWWLLSTISFTTDEGTFSYTRTGDTDDEYGSMVADDEYDCCVFFNPVCAEITRKIILIADYAAYDMTVTQSGIVVSSGTYACPPGGTGYIPRECDCCNDTVTATPIATLPQDWDGYYLGAVLYGIHDDCDCCDGDTGCMSVSISVGAPLASCGHSCLSTCDTYCGAGVSLTIDGDIICLAINDGPHEQMYIPCNDKHPLYDAITDDEWSYAGTAYVGCCDDTAVTVTVSE